MGTNAESTVYARNVPVSITGVTVSPVCLALLPRTRRETKWSKEADDFQGDIVFCDSQEGVVIIPQELLDEALSLMPKLVAADDKVKDAVSRGTTVAAAFKAFRG